MITKKCGGHFWTTSEKNGTSLTIGPLLWKTNIVFSVFSSFPIGTEVSGFADCGCLRLEISFFPIIQIRNLRLSPSSWDNRIWIFLRIAPNGWDDALATHSKVWKVGRLWGTTSSLVFIFAFEVIFCFRWFINYRVFFSYWIRRRYTFWNNKCTHFVS